MKKTGLTIAIILFGFVGTSFAYLENKVFCTISPNSITVTLDRQSNYRCTDYITVLSQAINKEYKNVLAIQELIQQQYDTKFWMNIREDKRDQIKKMLLVKQQIEDSVLVFEENLFDKTKEYVIYKIDPYKLKYERSLKPLEGMDNRVHLRSDIKRMIKLMQEQLKIIDKIFIAEEYNTLMTNFNKYLYFKKQIEGN